VIAKSRKGKDNFVSCMRQSLDHYYGNFRTVGMGGVFCIETGQAKLHVMVSKGHEYVLVLRLGQQCIGAI
jgi:hypothetical protein